MTISISAVIALNDDPRVAARFYAEGFNSNIKSNSTTLAIGGMNLELIEDGNHQLAPTVSFMVRSAPGQENQLRKLWEHLMADDEIISGGTALMPLTGYGFSPLFGWLADGGGVSWQLMVDPSPGEAGSTDAAAKTANPTVIPYFMWTGDELQAVTTTEAYNQLFGSGNFMMLSSPDVHKLTFGDGVAMHVSSDSVKEIENACQALGLTDAGVAEGTGAVVKPGVQPQPDRSGVYWTL